MTLAFPKSIADPNGAPRAGFSANPVRTVPAGPADMAARFAEVMRASELEGAAKANEAVTLGSDNDASEDRFMTLLVAQMRNQDPLNPLENAEVTTQLAQINTVRGIEGMSRSLETLLARLGGGDPLQASSMLGKSVLIEGQSLEVGAADIPVTGGARLSEAAGRVEVEILDADGNAVRSLPLGAQPAGVTVFEWDGRDASGDPVDAGTYQFRVVAYGEGSPQPLATLATQKVTGVTRDGEALQLRLQSGASVPSSAISGVF